jgi:hypothetical protein
VVLVGFATAGEEVTERRDGFRVSQQGVFLHVPKAGEKHALRSVLDIVIPPSLARVVTGNGT